MWLTQPLPALSAVYSTTWPSASAGRERLGESHLGKTMAGAVPSITNIYSLFWPVLISFAPIVWCDILTHREIDLTWTFGQVDWVSRYVYCTIFGYQISAILILYCSAVKSGGKRLLKQTGTKCMFIICLFTTITILCICIWFVVFICLIDST